MNAVETRYLTPSQRVSVYYDDSTNNPLTDWDHGIAFWDISNAGSKYEQQFDSFSNGDELTFKWPGEYREWYGDNVHWHQLPEQNAPSARTYLNKHAVWLPLVKWHDGTLGDGRQYGPDSWDIIAYVPLATIRNEYGAKVVRQSLRDTIINRINGAVDTYSSWVTGDVYYLVEELHHARPNICTCEDVTAPDADCPAWGDGETIGGIIGADNIDDSITDYFPTHSVEHVAIRVWPWPEYKRDNEGNIRYTNVAHFTGDNLTNDLEGWMRDWEAKHNLTAILDQTYYLADGTREVYGWFGYVDYSETGYVKTPYRYSITRRTLPNG